MLDNSKKKFMTEDIERLIQIKFNITQRQFDEIVEIIIEYFLDTHSEIEKQKALKSGLINVTNEYIN